MAMKQKPPRQAIAQKPVFGESRMLRMNEVELKLLYNRGGQEVSESVIVPKALITAMTDPGESEMGAMEAMRMLSEFNGDVLKPELRSLSEKGGVSVPAAMLSVQLQNAYSVHAVIAATDGKVAGGLMLENPKVKQRLRTIAATLRGVSLEEVKELDLRETTVWVGRTITVATRNPVVAFMTRRITCDRGSHKEEKDFTLPAGTSVAEARQQQEQRLRRLPQVQGELQAAYEEIEGLRQRPLSPDEKNAVVAHLNITYIKDPNQRLIVAP